jgi:phage shock protein A
MGSFMHKLRTATLGTVNDLLDKAIDLNSPSFMRQYVRDLEDALDQMTNQAAIQAGQVRTLSRELDSMQHTIDAKTKDAQNSLAKGNSDLARIQATEVVRLTKELESRTNGLGAQKQSSANTDKAVALLNEKHSQMITRLHELERLDRDSKMKEQSATAAAGFGKLIAGGADMSVDDIESKMRARNDVASEKFDRAMSGIQTTPEQDSETSAQVDDLLASLTPKVEKTA